MLGRALFNNALNLVSVQEYTHALTELGVSWRDIMPQEPEPGLGNGGLGRLAACFMDSLATLDMPAMGCTIRYEYGLFRQKLTGGRQVELPDDWLQNGNIWEIARTEDVVEVHFEGQVVRGTANGQDTFTLQDYRTVEAVPYDMPAVGYGNARVNTLRTWRARGKQGLDLAAFSNGDYLGAMKDQDLAGVISKVLYPEDNHYEGKTLRLCQQYFLVSATLQYALKDFERRHGRDYKLLPEKAVFHINDTHPGLAIPELMRLLMDEKGLGWDEAAAITGRCMAYTNHTVMQEALERWPEDLVRRQLPRIYMILEEMNRRLCEKLWDRYPGEWDRIARMAILAYGMVHMANLCVSQCFSVNGVSQLHGDILKRDTFRDYARIHPKKFSAITNGVTHRRWLMGANPRLAALITEAIGERWVREPEALSDLLPMREDPAFLERYALIKRQNKEVFSEFLTRRQDMAVDPDFVFDVQVKRLHEYKRQMLNALRIHVLYNRVMDDPSLDFQPRLFVFGAKASRGYEKAKLIIRYILALSRMIDGSTRAKKLLRVLFVEDWNVSAAEALIPAADLSEQISTAGKEASGTGNMKLMMNGAVTVGTLDGANVEIAQAVGPGNVYIFGMKAEEVEATHREGTYTPVRHFEENDEIRKALTQMIDGKLFPDNPALLQQLYHDLLFGHGGQKPDDYFVLRDFGAYDDAHKRIEADLRDRDGWLRKAVTNTAMSGIFSTDRTIADYNRLIWKLK